MRKIEHHRMKMKNNGYMRWVRSALLGNLIFTIIIMSSD